MNSPAIDQLKQLASPPLMPSHSEGDWSVVESAMELKFPEEYKQFIQTYGCVSFGGVFQVYNFLDEKDRVEALEYLDLLRNVQSEIKQERQIILEQFDGPSTQQTVMPLYPEENGLVLWGTFQDGWYFYWRPDGPPESWSIIVAFGLFERPHWVRDKSFLEFLIEFRRTPLNEVLRLPQNCFARHT